MDLIYSSRHVYMSEKLIQHADLGRMDPFFLIWPILTMIKCIVSIRHSYDGEQKCSLSFSFCLLCKHSYISREVQAINI